VDGRIRYDRISSAPGTRHAGVIVILSLVCQMLADAAVLPDLRRAVILAVGVVTLGVGLLRSPQQNWRLSFSRMRFEYLVR
jgi:hypothetical protein